VEANLIKTEYCRNRILGLFPLHKFDSGNSNLSTQRCLHLKTMSLKVTSKGH
jgi:hypothetical protein